MNYQTALNCRKIARDMQRQAAFGDDRTLAALIERVTKQSGAAGREALLIIIATLAKDAADASIAAMGGDRDAFVKRLGEVDEIELLNHQVKDADTDA